MTRAELLDELTTERFGPTPRTQNRRPTPAEVVEFEAENERAQQRIRRQILEQGAKNGPAMGAA